MKTFCRHIVMSLALALSMCSCMTWGDDVGGEVFDAVSGGLFITNEGNFQYSNATLSYYNPTTGQVENEVFYRANGYRIGDVAQSLTMYGGKCWIVVNNSHVVWAIDPVTFKELGRIENLTSPRFIHFVNDEKAYISQLWDNRIAVVNPQTYEVTRYITVPAMSAESGSTEQMVQYGRYVYCTCWSYQNSIIKIDTKTDMVVGKLEIGIQPRSLVLDRNGKLWTITDGGYEGSPYGHDAPALWRIDPESFEVEKKFAFRRNDSPGSLCVNGSLDELYWINDGVWRMSVDDNRLPVRPFIESRDTKYYGLTVDPVNGDVYLADAIDYQQQGIIYRYTDQGELLAEFYVGINPGSFSFL